MRTPASLPRVFPRRLTAVALLAGVLPCATSVAVAQAAPPAVPSPTTLAALDGTVYDSLAHAPLAGARVQLIPDGAPTAPGYVADADARGRFAFADVAPGRYVLGFLHPRVDELGLALAPRVVRVAAPGTRADLAIPAARRVATAICAGLRSGDAEGVLAGRVLDGDGAALAAGGSAVSVRWGEVRVDSTGVRRVVREVRAPIGEGGRFIACDVPTDVPVLVQARPGTDSAASDSAVGDSAERPGASGAIEVAFARDEPFRWREIVVATAERRGAAAASARLTGLARRPDGRPLEGARVRVRAPGQDTVVMSDRDGRFRVAALPAGSWPVEALAVGFAPLRTAVDLRTDTEHSLDLGFTKRVQTLEPVSSYAAGIDPRSAFARRSRLGIGTFLTGEQLRARHPIFIADALIGVPGLRVSGISKGRAVFDGPFRCVPSYFFNGFYIPEGVSELDNIGRLGEVGGVEVYRDAITAPTEFRQQVIAFGGVPCAMVLVWTIDGLR